MENPSFDLLTHSYFLHLELLGWRFYCAVNCGGGEAQLPLLRLRIQKPVKCDYLSTSLLTYILKPIPAVLLCPFLLGNQCSIPVLSPVTSFIPCQHEAI